MNTTLIDQPFPEGVTFASPAKKILVLDYYDGPTEGLLQCETGRVFRFEIVAWDSETQDVRVFSLAPMPPSAFDRLAELIAQVEMPRWPVWIPSWCEDQNEETDAILKEAGPVEWVIAAEDLIGTILAAKRVRPSEVDAVVEWRSFLGLGDNIPDLAPTPAR
jgi:hypothetical protein